MKTCQYPGCNEPVVAHCDLCHESRGFCSDHGTKGGDRQVQDVGAVAFPSACWLCGGFCADEGSETA